MGGCSRSENYPQPIAYNHAKHIQEAGLGCIDCHIQAETHERASIPNIQVCQDCHEEAITDSPEEKKLIAYINNHNPIPWIQVHRVPDHVYFSHRRHVALGKITCEQCHGPVAEMTTPFTRPAIPVSMAFCVECHENNQVTTDCASCHR